jgi:hypothetical protein
MIQIPLRERWALDVYDASVYIPPAMFTRQGSQLAKHDGPGPHDNGSSQDVHGNDHGLMGSANAGVNYTIADGPSDLMVRRLMNEYVPDAHTDGLQEINFNEGMIHNGITEAYGTYHPPTAKITLAHNADNIAVFGGATVVHEVGHHVHLAKMTDEGAAAWGAISQKGQSAKISAYARTNQGEHFAEAYRAYQRGEHHRKNLKALEPSAYNFMRSIKKYILPAGQYADTTNWRLRYDGG